MLRSINPVSNDLDEDVDRIQRFLVKYHIICGIPETFSENAPDVYFYSFQSKLTADQLEEDSYQYFLRRGGDLKERRCCFLTLHQENIVALVFNLRNPKSEEAKKLYVGGEIKDKSCFLRARKELYGNIDVAWVGRRQTQEATREVLALLKDVYKTKIVLNFIFFDDNRNRLDQLGIACLKWLQPETLQKIHRQNMIRHLLEKINIIDASIRMDLEKKLAVVAKYYILIKEANALDKKTDKSDPEQTLIMMSNYENYKKKVYQAVLKPNECLNLLPLFILERLSVARVSVWPDTLSEIQSKALAECMIWEAEKKKLLSRLTWPRAIRHKGEEALNFLYQTSFIVFGANLILWLIKPITKHFPGKQRMVRRTESIAYWAGGGLGLIYCYYLGNYSMVRMACINLVAHKVNAYQDERCIDNKTASYKEPLFSSIGTFRAVNAVAMVIESGYTGNYRYLLQGITGLLGNVGSVRLLQSVYPEFSQSEGRVSEKNQFVLFAVSVIGNSLGHQLSILGLQMRDRVVHKQLMALDFLQNLRMTSGVMDAEVRTTSNVTWQDTLFEDSAAIEAEWHNRSGTYFRTFCSLFPISQNTIEVTCTSATEQVPRLMPPK